MQKLILHPEKMALNRSSGDTEPDFAQLDNTPPQDMLRVDAATIAAEDLEMPVFARGHAAEWADTARSLAAIERQKDHYFEGLE